MMAMAVVVAGPSVFGFGMSRVPPKRTATPPTIAFCRYFFWIIYLLLVAPRFAGRRKLRGLTRELPRPFLNCWGIHKFNTFWTPCKGLHHQKLGGSRMGWI